MGCINKIDLNNNNFPKNPNVYTVYKIKAKYQ